MSAAGAGAKDRFGSGGSFLNDINESAYLPVAVRIVAAAKIDVPGHVWMQALDAGGFQRFKKDKPQMARKFASELFFREKLTKPFLAVLVNGLQRGHSIDDLRQRARLVADKFFRIFDGAVPPATAAEYYAAALLQMNRQTEQLKAQGISAQTPAEPRGSAASRWPDWCSDGSRNELEFDDVRNMLNEGRVFYGFVGALYGFAGDNENALKVVEEARKRLPEDINVNVAVAEYVSLGRPSGQFLREESLERAQKHIAMALDQAKEQARRVATFQPGDPVDKDIKQLLTYRYRRAELDLKREAAYFWAQESFKHIGPWDDVILPYAKENYDAYLDKTQPLATYPCIDDFIEVSILDVYAYTKSAFQSYNKRRWQSPIDKAEIAAAGRALDAADRKLKAANAPACIGNERKKKLWQERLANHQQLNRKQLD
jgi:hypothetical protein